MSLACTAGGRESVGPSDHADETGTARRYECQRIDNNHSAAEAGVAIRLTLQAESAEISDIELDDHCDGPEQEPSKQLAGQFRLFNIGGPKCSADGYDALIEKELFKGADAGVVLIDANETTDTYHCTPAPPDGDDIMTELADVLGPLDDVELDWRAPRNARLLARLRPLPILFVKAATPKTVDAWNAALAAAHPEFAIDEAEVVWRVKGTEGGIVGHIVKAAEKQDGEQGAFLYFDLAGKLVAEVPFTL